MALSDERIAELKEVALKIAPLHRSAARPFARSIEAEVRKEYEARIAELEAQLEAVGAGGVGAMMPRHAQPAPAVVGRVASSAMIARLRENHATWRDTIDRCAEAADLLEVMAQQPQQPPQIAEPAGNATPGAKGIYAWVPENGPPALLLVNKRPSSHSPGGILNAHVLQSPSFYDGCAVSQWGPGCWILLRNLEIKKEPS